MNSEMIGRMTVARPEVAEGTVLDAPNVWVQYKGTSLCADFHCACGASGHVDEMFAYSVRCGSCGQVWVLPQTLALTRLEDASQEDRRWHSDGVPVVMDED